MANRAYNTNFGTSVSNALAEARLTQSEVATSARISQPYFNQMLTGLKKPSPEWVDIIASTLNFSKEKRRELHVAAAKDYGFKL
jgi:hypothetical protein